MSTKYTGCIQSGKRYKKKAATLSLYRSRNATKRKLWNPPSQAAKRQKPIQFNTNITFTHCNTTSDVEENIDVTSLDQETSNFTFSIAGVKDFSQEPLYDAQSPPPPPPNNQPNASYEQQCANELCDRAAVGSLIQHLQHHGMLQHFMTFFQLLSSGEMSPLEIPVLLCLERAYFQGLKSTTQMKYHHLTKKFFAMGYKLFGNSFLEFCSGPKSYGQVISKQSNKGKFKPHQAKVNFCVPNKRHLNYGEEFVQKEIPPGIISQSLDLVENKSDMILMLDAKKISRGLKVNFILIMFKRKKFWPVWDSNPRPLHHHGMQCVYGICGKKMRMVRMFGKK